MIIIILITRCLKTHFTTYGSLNASFDSFKEQKLMTCFMPFCIQLPCFPAGVLHRGNWALKGEIALYPTCRLPSKAKTTERIWYIKMGLSSYIRIRIFCQYQLRRRSIANNKNDLDVLMAGNISQRDPDIRIYTKFKRVRPNSFFTASFNI